MRTTTAGPGVRAASLAGADVDPSTGSLLSIAQLQAALRARTAPLAPVHEDERPPAVMPAVMPDAIYTVVSAPVPATQWVGERAGVTVAGGPHPGPLPEWLAEVPGSLLVVGAHSGAGSSTVAVAIAEAASRLPAPGTAGSVVPPGSVHLVDCSPAAREGLAGVTDAELGVGACGRWRHGRRGRLTVSRPVDDLPVTPPDTDAPLFGAAAREDVRETGVTVLDLGCHLDDLARVPAGPVVVVFRPTLPSLQRLEVTLTRLTALGVTPLGPRPVVVAAVGPARWPRQVRACAGPLLQQAHRAGLVVTVPLNRRLAVAGLGSGPLPRKVTATGTRLWQLAGTAARSALVLEQPLPVQPARQPPAAQEPLFPFFFDSQEQQ
ncbi:hypothetical protein [Kineosporia sp. A_224]|uniref:hypothetical protein n=1 Tax=Kineosporia sp. A_224 TaxID=1962180 RepID=UPI00117A453C|nr:hypothetical protein [Kineosporia sp. A_224]